MTASNIKPDKPSRPIKVGASATFSINPRSVARDLIGPNQAAQLLIESRKARAASSANSHR